MESCSMSSTGVEIFIRQARRFGGFHESFTLLESSLKLKLTERSFLDLCPSHGSRKRKERSRAAPGAAKETKSTTPESFLSLSRDSISEASLGIPEPFCDT
jgi:hypothetical protein